MNIEKANELLEKYIQNLNLRKHCYAVESCMRFYAEKLVTIRQAQGEKEDTVMAHHDTYNINPEDWQIAGLLHDLDWEFDPDKHPLSAIPILKEAGATQEIIDAILGHAYPTRSDVPRTSLMAKYLFACDELSGFIVAYALMKQGKLNDVDAAGVARKLKEKRFAEKVSREDITLGLEEIGLSIEEHASNLIEAMKADKRLGLS